MDFWIYVTIFCQQIGSILTTPACALSSRCQACSTTTTTDCDQCYNWERTAYAGAASLADRNRCTATSLPSVYAITNCEHYTDYSPSDVYVGLTSTSIVPRCQKCHNLIYLKIDSVLGTEECSDTPYEHHYNSNSSWSQANCSELVGCNQTVCYQGVSKDYDYVWCIQCNYGYFPANIKQMDSTTQFRAARCVAFTPTTSKITNCYLYTHVGTDTTVQCSVCETGYVASYDMTKCEPDQASTNYCNRLVSGSTTDCYECWNAYMFDGVTCTKGVFILAPLLGVLSITIIVFSQ